MSTIRLSGTTSGHYDLTVPSTAGTNSIDLSKLPVKDASNIIPVDGLKHTGGTTTMTFDSAGRVTTPSQPYFEACFGSTGWTDYATGGTWVKLDMDATITNVGNHYDTTNKRFVAPVTGKYFFSACAFLNVSWNSSTPYLSYIGFYKNNAFFAHFGQDVQSTEHIRHSIIVPMQANDYMDVRIQQAQTPASNQYYKQANARNYTYFHGMLMG